MALQGLPVELRVMVGTYLTDDKDLCSYSQACRQTRTAIQFGTSAVWRSRFASEYDLRPFQPTILLMEKYQNRQMVLSRNLRFSHGESTQEQDCLLVIREMVIETFANVLCDRRDSFGDRISNNLEKLRYFIRKSDLLEAVFRWRGGLESVDPLLKMAHLLFTHWSLEFSFEIPTYGFSESQQAVYSHPDEVPMFEDDLMTVNIDLLLHVANFFKNHITSIHDYTLFSQYQQLAEDQKPRSWKNRIQQGVTRLGRSWKGSSAYLHNAKMVQDIRSAEPGRLVFIDTIEYHDGFVQTLNLDWQLTNWTSWPRDFEKHLHALPSPLLAALSQGHAVQDPQMGRDYFPFTGTGIDGKPYHCSGIIHAIPKQNDIPGWQRITMMKYFDLEPDPAAAASSSSGSSSTANDTFNPYTPGWTAFGDDGKGGSSIDMSHNNYWAFEGVVLPGGMIMLGRWWSPLDSHSPDRYSIGPFIFWTVPDEDLIGFPTNP